MIAGRIRSLTKECPQTGETITVQESIHGSRRSIRLVTSSFSTSIAEQLTPSTRAQTFACRIQTLQPSDSNSKENHSSSAPIRRSTFSITPLTDNGHLLSSDRTNCRFSTIVYRLPWVCALSLIG